MRSKFAAIALVTALAATSPSLASDARTGTAGQTYLKEGASWIQRDVDGSEYAINTRVITVRFRKDISRSSQEALHGSLGYEELRRSATGFVDVQVPSGVDVFAAIDAYVASGSVEIAEPNTIGEYTIVPNDPSYGTQTWLPLINAEEAWDTQTGAPTAVISVLDSGTEFSHDDLGLGSDSYQNVWLNPGEDAWSSPDNPGTGNGVDDDMNGFVDDWKGWNFDGGNNNSSGSFFHGTAVAGAVAAKTNNGSGIAGTAGGWNNPGARVMIGNVGNTAPNGSVLDDAIDYSVANGAQVVQLSLSVGTSAAIDAAIQNAVDKNVTVICASGNGGQPTVSYPALNTNVIAVGATTTTDTRAGFSNHGPLVEVSAPGTNFVTLSLNDGFTNTQGTSFSAPTVSGVVALMLSANPALTAAQVRQILRDTADKVGGYNYNWNAMMPGHSFELGYGRVNAESALAAVGAGAIFADGFESGDITAWSASSTP